MEKKRQHKIKLSAVLLTLEKKRIFPGGSSEANSQALVWVWMCVWVCVCMRTPSPHTHIHTIQTPRQAQKTRTPGKVSAASLLPSVQTQNQVCVLMRGNSYRNQSTWAQGCLVPGAETKTWQHSQNGSWANYGPWIQTMGLDYRIPHWRKISQGPRLYTATTLCSQRNV